jgi:hypothetical protein
MFETKLKLCTKKIYNYQKNAIYKLRELELSGFVVNNSKKVVSNGYLLSLPVGSGKSLVFLFLAIFYRSVPKHPIIISVDGRNIPQHEQLQWKYYPTFTKTVVSLNQKQMLFKFSKTTHNEN